MPWVKDFKIKSLGIKEEWVYDIEVENNHNFFANDILVHNSNYINCGEIWKKLGLEGKVEPIEYFKFCDEILAEIFKQSIHERNKELKPKKETINFLREKYIMDFLSCAKKKYAIRILQNEDDYYGLDNLKFKVQGLELKKSDCPLFCKKVLGECINKIFDLQSKDAILEWLNKVKEDYMKAPIDEIARRQGVGKYAKWVDEEADFDDDESPDDKLGMIQNVKASQNYNWLIKKEGLDMSPIMDGTKIRYFMCDPKKNKFGFELFGWIGDFNPIFKEKYGLEPERKSMFDITLLRAVSRLLEAPGFVKKDKIINLKQFNSVLDDLF